MSAHGRLGCGALACLAALLLPVTPSQAQGPSAAAPAPTPEPWRGFYVGGGGAYSNVSVDVYGGACGYECYYWWGDYSGYDQGDGEFGYSLHAGWRVHRYFALEVSYLDTGTIGWDENLVYMPEFDDYYNNRVDFSAEVAEASVLGIFPFLETWEVYLRLGAGFWDGKSEQRLDQSFGPAVVTRRVDDSGTGFLIGMGVGVSFADALHVRLDLQTVGIDREALNAQDDSSLDSLLLEVQYRFGAH
jgi:hypothetical protein